MIGRAVGELDGRNVDDSLSGTLRNDVHKAVKILAGITEAHATADARFIIRSGAAHEESDHALVLVPDIHHPVQLIVFAAQLVITQKAVPIGSQLFKSCIHGLGIRKFGADPLGRILTDDAGGHKFLISGILAVAQDEGGTGAFARCQGDGQVLAANGIPAYDFALGTALFPHQLGIPPLAHMTQEAIPVRIPACGGHIDTVEGIVIPAFPVLGFMINHAVFHFGFGDVQVSLVILGIIGSVPQTPLHTAPDMDGFYLIRFVGQHQIVQFAVFTHRHKESYLSPKAILAAVEGGIAHTVTAFVSIQSRSGGQETGVPGFFAGFLNVVKASAVVTGYRIIAVTQDTLELCIPIEAVAATGVGNHAKKVLAAQIVDPGQGRCGRGDHILPTGVIEISKLHGSHLLKSGLTTWYTNFTLFSGGHDG